MEMDRTDIINESNECITKDRAATHGDAEDSFNNIAFLWTWWINTRQDQSIKLSAHDVAIMMSLFKHARIAGNAFHLDNYVDSIGYQAIAGEIIQGYT